MDEVWQIAAGIIAKQGSVALKAVNVRPDRTVILKYFILMNVPLRMDNHRWIDDQPVADFHITPPKTLFPVRVPEEALPDLKETLPALFMVAACADGTSYIAYQPEFQSTVDELLALGADITLENNTLTIIGKPGLKSLCTPLVTARVPLHKESEHA